MPTTKNDKPRMYGVLVALLMLAVGLSGCESDAAKTPTATWHQDVRGGMEKWCGSCHTDGGIGPFSLTDRNIAKQMIPASIAAIENGTMPPYRANDDCRQYNGQWMNDKQAAELVTALKNWRDSDFAEGAKTDYVKPEIAEDPLKAAGAPSLKLKAEKGYVPNDKVSDDYRCFVLPHTFTNETFLRMSHVIPHQKDLVHHVLVYVVPKNFLGALDSLEKKNAGIGYECFGGAGVGSPNPVAGWAPGDAPAMTPEGTAVRIPAGSKLVMQVHYNLAAKAAEDQTELQLWTTEDKPKFLLRSRPMPHFGIQIPPGAKDSTHTRLFKNQSKEDWHIIATTPHMHTFGKKIGVDRIDKDGKRECLIDVQNYDFNWQISYPFAPDEPVIVKPGESLELRCSYDNTAANQPMVNGKQITPKEVRWGEGTLDEMCLNYILVKEPYAPIEDTTNACPDFDKCFPDCRKTKEVGTCLLECGGKSGGKCQSCVYTATILCGLSGHCVSDTAPLYECIEDCNTQGSCIFTKCTKQISTFEKCIGPQVDAGACRSQLQGCGVEL